MTVDPAEHGVQVARLHRLLRGWADRIQSWTIADPSAEALRWGLLARDASRGQAVLGRNLGAEVGQPGAPAHKLVLTTRRSDLIRPGAVHALGSRLSACGPGRPRAFAQVIVLRIGPDAPPRQLLESAGFLANRLPGHMARTVPGRLWLRFSRELLDLGFGWRDLGAVLLAAHDQDFPAVEAGEVLLLADDAAAVRALDSIAAEVQVLSGQQTKLSLVGEGEAECADLNCDGCEHRDLCDALRDITVRYRQRSHDASEPLN